MVFTSQVKTQIKSRAKHLKRQSRQRNASSVAFEIEANKKFDAIVEFVGVEGESLKKANSSDP